MDLKKRLEELQIALRIDEKQQRVAELEAEMNAPDFWLDEKRSAQRTKELKNLQDETRRFIDLYEMVQIADDSEKEAFEKEVADLELLAYFNQRYDNHNVIINFFAGAGGVDAQDWTEMLMRMYLRWAEKNKVAVNIINETRGGEAGIKNATVELSGSYLYGRLKGESGVHRLVRQSPFNAKGLRQTSFALVEVMPEIESEGEIEIDPKDLRVDVFRSSGHGGQSVNTTDSAVRITHLPTNIVVSCQNERSQLQNKETAMRVLRSRLAKLMLEQHQEKINEIRGDFSVPEWGNQIRSYVIHPYKLVKDHRTGQESTNPDDVLGGNIDDFLKSEIRWFAQGKKD